ncbi:hypothetical protein [Paenibacillus tarimensis]|uniref:hypothetical protein n=1 Tax=Paenibacillus tarimensis TaxID=416012 RepID=UPI001F2556C2|nr:hypothetical protein [Paenibacillus tarimensis]MCF2943266.1 hypothetical protein [Paenibacillus tarimensis]
MITEEQLDEYRVQGIQVRVERDDMEANDVVGIVVAWDEEQVMIRKPSRRVVKLSRSYRYVPASTPRQAGQWES